MQRGQRENICMRSIKLSLKPGLLLGCSFTQVKKSPFAFQGNLRWVFYYLQEQDLAKKRIYLFVWEAHRRDLGRE